VSGDERSFVYEKAVGVQVGGELGEGARDKQFFYNHYMSCSDKYLS
jgi:hypothetical protein